MALNGSGIRETGRVLGISKDTVVSTLTKKANGLEAVSTTLLKSVHVGEVVVMIHPVDEAETDETWSLVSRKKQQRWL